MSRDACQGGRQLILMPYQLLLGTLPMILTSAIYVMNVMGSSLLRRTYQVSLVMAGLAKFVKVGRCVVAGLVMRLLTQEMARTLEMAATRGMAQMLVTAPTLGAISGKRISWQLEPSQIWRSSMRIMMSTDALLQGMHLIRMGVLSDPLKAGGLSSRPMPLAYTRMLRRLLSAATHLLGPCLSIPHCETRRIRTRIVGRLLSAICRVQRRRRSWITTLW